MINKVLIVGNLGNNPEVRSLPNGGQVANFSLATSDSWKDKDGQRREKTEWHRVVVFNANLIAVVEKYLKKGMMVYVEGSLRTSKYTDKSGVERYTTEVVVQSYSDTLKILNNRSEGSGYAGEDGHGSSSGSRFDSRSSDNLSGSGSSQSSHLDATEDDIPF